VTDKPDAIAYEEPMGHMKSAAATNPHAVCELGNARLLIATCEPLTFRVTSLTPSI